MLDASPLQHASDDFTFLDRHSTDENRTALPLNLVDFAFRDAMFSAVNLIADDDFGIVVFFELADEVISIFHEDHIPLMIVFDFFSDRSPLVLLATVDHIRMGDPLKHAIGRNRDYVKFINLVEFFRFGHRGTRHTANLLVKLEIVLQRDRGERLSLFLDLHAFFGFDRLMQAVTPLPSVHQTTSKLIHDDDLAFFDDVIDILLVKPVGLQSVVNHVRPVHVASGVKTLNARKLFRIPDTFISQCRGMVFFVDLIVNFF